jgi:hypothetical protein
MAEKENQDKDKAIVDLTNVFGEDTKRDEIRSKFSDILSDKNLMKKYNINWIIHNSLWVNLLKSKSLQDLIDKRHSLPERFWAIVSNPNVSQEQRAKATEEFKDTLRRFDALLREIPPKGELAVLEELLLDMMNSGNDTGALVATLKEKGRGYIERVRGDGDIGTARALERSILAATGEEVGYLRKYLQEVLAWRTLRQRSQYFTQRLWFFIRGNQNPALGLDYKGIATHFKDGKLLRAIRKSDVLKLLAGYAELRSLFASIMRKIRAGLEEKDWRDFIEFWNHRKHYRELIGERYGAEKFAAMMKADVKRIGEDPIGWERELLTMIHTLDDPAYVTNKVVIPASRELSIIFMERIRELDHERKTAVSDLVKTLDKRIKEIRGFMGRLIAKLGRIVSREKVKLVSKWEKTKREFSRREDFYLVRRIDFFENYQLVSADLDVEKKLKYQDKISKTISQFVAFIRSRTGSLTNLSKSVEDFSEHFRLAFSLQKFDDLKERLIVSEAKMTDMDDNTYIDVKKIVKKGSKMSRSSARLIGYISDKLNEFTIGIKDLERMIPVPKNLQRVEPVQRTEPEMAKST